MYASFDPPPHAQKRIRPIFVPGGYFLHIYFFSYVYEGKKAYMNTPPEIITKEEVRKHSARVHSITSLEIVEKPPSESAEQLRLVKHLRSAGLAVFAIPNGGSRNKIEALNLKRQGVSAGVPDLFVVSRPPLAPECRGVFIEMKRTRPADSKRHMLSPEQLAWHDVLKSCGFTVLTCYGAASALDALRGMGFAV